MEALTAMFPEIDADTLGTVLESCNNNTEAAVEVLLGVTVEQAAAAPQQPQQPQAFSDDPFVDPAAAAALARQMAQDEELARQLQQQIVFEQEDAQMQRQQQQMLVAQQHQHAALGGHGGGYPGAAAYAGGGYHPSVHRPANWGAEAPAAARRADEDEGLGIGSAIYSAGSAVGSAVGSLWSWATAPEPAESSAASGRREAAGGAAADGSRELQTIRRGTSRGFSGPNSMARATGDEGTQDERSLYDGDEGIRDVGSTPSATAGSRMADAQVVRGDEGYAGGGASGGEVRRRARHATQAAEHHDIL